MKQAICIDIDWTLCYLKDEENKHNYTGEEILRQDIYDEIDKNYSPVYFTRIILTGRKYEFHDLTEKWLKDNNIRYDYLIMCKEWKPDENHVFKKRTLRVLQQMYDIRMTYDDNPNMEKVCRRLKIPFKFC